MAAAAEVTTRAAAAVAEVLRISAGETTGGSRITTAAGEVSVSDLTGAIECWRAISHHCCWPCALMVWPLLMLVTCASKRPWSHDAAAFVAGTRAPRSLLCTPLVVCCAAVLPLSVCLSVPRRTNPCNLLADAWIPPLRGLHAAVQHCWAQLRTQSASCFVGADQPRGGGGNGGDASYSVPDAIKQFIRRFHEQLSTQVALACFCLCVCCLALSTERFCSAATSSCVQCTEVMLRAARRFLWHYG